MKFSFIFVKNIYILEQTIQQYNRALKKCRKIFLDKTKDYGTSWRILRPRSITDQLFIKASRIRSIEEKGGKQKVGESVVGEYIAIVNYSIIAMIQISLSEDSSLELEYDLVKELYDKESSTTRELMLDKNHDYGEAWRD